VNLIAIRSTKTRMNRLAIGIDGLGQRSISASSSKHVPRKNIGFFNRLHKLNMILDKQFA